jgi:hypothetical protein
MGMQMNAGSGDILIEGESEVRSSVERGLLAEVYR